MNFSEKFPFMVVLLALCGGALDSRAEAASDPAGFYKVDLLGNSDTFVSIPFSRAIAAQVLVESTAGNGVTVSGLPGWLTNQFVYAPVTQSNTYYVRIQSGAYEGLYYPVLANGTNTLDLDLNGDNLSSVTNGTRIGIFPYWTLATAFPEGRSVIPTSQIGDPPKTAIYIPNFSGVGINLSPGAPYYYLKPEGSSTGSWRKVGSPTVVRDDDVLLSDVYFIVRHRTTTSTVFTAQGSVPVSKLTTPLNTRTAGPQDNFVALNRPMTNTLNQSGLFESGAFRASTEPGVPADELRLFNNSQVAQNKAPGSPYYYYNGAWRRVGSAPTIDMGTDPVLLPGTGFLIRKKATSDGATTNWTNSPNY